MLFIPSKPVAITWGNEMCDRITEVTLSHDMSVMLFGRFRQIMHDDTSGSRVCVCVLWGFDWLKTLLHVTSLWICTRTRSIKTAIILHVVWLLGHCHLTTT